MSRPIIIFIHFFNSNQNIDYNFYFNLSKKLISLLSDADGEAIELAQPETEEKENDSVEIDFNSVLRDDYSCLEFDIPKDCRDSAFTCSSVAWINRSDVIME